jgi:hypothetical protein
MHIKISKNKIISIKRKKLNLIQQILYFCLFFIIIGAVFSLCFSQDKLSVVVKIIDWCMQTSTTITNYLIT